MKNIGIQITELADRISILINAEFDKKDIQHMVLIKNEEDDSPTYEDWVKAETEINRRIFEIAERNITKKNILKQYPDIGKCLYEETYPDDDLIMFYIGHLFNDIIENLEKSL